MHLAFLMPGPMGTLLILFIALIIFGKNLPSAASERIFVRLDEVDGEESVTIEEAAHGDLTSMGPRDVQAKVIALVTEFLTAGRS